MTEREQLQRVCEWNRQLVRENTRLREELGRVEQERDELSDANVNLRVEREAADALLGAAMDGVLEVDGR